jgi:uncharacterized GH25 family protein
MKLKCLLIVAGLAMAAPASAHDLWLTFSGRAKATRAIVNYGHPGDRPPPLVDKVVDIAAYAADDKIDLLEGLASASNWGTFVVQSRTFADNGHMLLAARYDNGMWVKRPDGTFRNAGKRLVADAVDSMWSLKFAKTLTGPGAPFDRVLGHTLELVPLSDPAAAKAGGSLRVRVLFKGQPLAAADVIRGDGVTHVADNEIAKFSTDKEGVASVPIVKGGPHLLVIDHKTPSATPDQAATDLYNATLWFVALK